MLKEIDKCLPAGHKKTCSIYLFTEIYKNITLLKKVKNKSTLSSCQVNIKCTNCDKDFRCTIITFKINLLSHLKLTMIAKGIVTSAIFLLTDK